MPKFRVRLTREVSEEAELTIDAASEDAVWDVVGARIDAGEEFENLSWSGYDIDRQSLEVMNVEPKART